MFEDYFKDQDSGVALLEHERYDRNMNRARNYPIKLNYLFLPKEIKAQCSV